MTDTPVKDSQQNSNQATAAHDARASDAFQRPEQRFFGRRKGQALSGKRQDLMDSLYPRLALTPESDGDAWTAATLFDKKVSELWLEIGFGKGEHLAWQAAHNPSVGILGCEPYLNGVAALLDKLHEDEDMCGRVRVYADDARHVMKSLSDASLDRLFLIHPDPWPKWRHARRRFVNPIMLDEISRLLKPGGEFRLATDHPIYREWSLIQMCHRSDFEWVAERPSDWKTRPADWPATRYAEKALEGDATFLIYRRSAETACT